MLHFNTMANSDTLLPALIDSLAAGEPNKLFCAYVKSAAEPDVLHQVTYKAFANAVNACAWWLQDTLGEGFAFETTAYFGPSDIQPAVFTLAAAKVNRKARLL
jgi:acyl-coenzyme A synthetase/AMP-(fatty) acid ligase